MKGVGSIHAHVQGPQAEMSEVQLMAEVLSKHRRNHWSWNIVPVFYSAWSSMSLSIHVSNLQVE